jgi:hypothetical protein
MGVHGQVHYRADVQQRIIADDMFRVCVPVQSFPTQDDQELVHQSVFAKSHMLRIARETKNYFAR